ncbi:hypothetical protein [Piscinibacter gummiphilus]|uniref:Uncharacterized protein n=1 Tax=Piscinibacter gummiphilus TaxID=946333 RepID=A0A1W6LAP3_9BURK|nr:hypothetical protein [Piscinibacter gummiphilus]ARN21365.1 hypothetical protein A4W93_16485 [Piscinibacter gummiphilus]ATU66051.1 hypothetical protein CPZ87_16570 [Piscinibacter gummiphilus]GLS96288.1 hypothetical protein GCM10007918_35800 [Piscinibacter gummiphilus]
MRDVNIKAVTLGVLVSLAVVLVLSVILFAVFGGHLLDTEMGDAEFEAAVNALVLTPAVMFWTFAASAVATVLGAFTTTRIAQRALFPNIVAFLVVSVVLSLLVSDNIYPLWAEVVSYVLMLPSAYAGVYLASRPGAARRS